MTIDTTYPPAPPRPTRPARARKEAARFRRHRRIDIGRRRSRFIRLPPSIDPTVALAHFMEQGDFYKVGKINYLVAPIRDDMLDALIVASAASEDDGLYLRADSTVATGDDEEDNEDRGVDDEPHDEVWQDMEPSLAGISAGMQPGIDMGDREGPDDDMEDEHDDDGVNTDDDHGFYAPNSQDARFIAAARARHRAKRATTIDHGDGQIYNITYDVSGARILTPAARVVIGKMGGAA